TCGELARMLNDRQWIAASCRLTVVKMRGWERQMIWQDTGLRWVQTSPNIPRADSPAYYVATGIVGSLAGLETGVGGEAPFEICAGKGIDPESFTRFVQNLNLDGVQARPCTVGGFGGCRLSVNPRGKGDLSFLALALLSEVNRLSKPDLFAKSSPDKLDIFFKVYGTSNIRDQLRKGVPFQRLAQDWKSGVEKFRSERSAYLFY
ncbi:MAG: exo-beta-N-acetylmuramidase NamZ domain-containing protein, partial [Verrucomicrobiota bacterium]